MVKKVKFEGRTEELAGYVFDIIDDITEDFISANQNLEYRERGAA